MATQLSIRCYSFVSQTHTHDYHQLVLPLFGSIEIETEQHHGRVGPGQCVILPCQTEHQFTPSSGGNFLVADLDTLPAALLDLDQPFVRVAEPMQRFCQFVQTQLQHRVSPQLERRMAECFDALLAEQAFAPQLEPRIAKVVEHLENELERTPSLTELAQLACLSLSQFKALFKQQTGKSSMQYLQQLRMHKARALLAHTDTPVGIVASQVGYQDLSAFSHRFAHHFGHPPSKLRAK